ncbi:conserved hypothetical protein [Ricinus communis]|uniref:Uncharacterized protein n=1 Tax=Ricinus communis TaxID=3988 RepID=B9T5J4_RICCO|nr:conserved hypothetical protein [Ricinus communis]
MDPACCLHRGPCMQTQPGDCHFFEWVEDKLTDKMKEALLKLVSNKAVLDEKLKFEEAKKNVLEENLKKIEAERRAIICELYAENESKALMKIERN